MIYWSRHSDKYQSGSITPPCRSCSPPAGWLLASATDHNLIQLLGIVMASTGSFSAMAIFWTTPDQSISLRARAIGIAVINATGNIGSALSPFMIGWLKDITGSFSSGLWFVAAPGDCGDHLGDSDEGLAPSRDTVRSRYVPKPNRQHRYQ
jgi:ACS family 4-hydroxyphenylacetate permease-like MFS transporter